MDQDKLFKLEAALIAVQESDCGIPMTYRSGIDYSLHWVRKHLGKTQPTPVLDRIKARAGAAK
jgi:hypothetical protein